jgi:hypothetical protein
MKNVRAAMSGFRLVAGKQNGLINCNMKIDVQDLFWNYEIKTCTNPTREKF